MTSATAVLMILALVVGLVIGVVATAMVLRARVRAEQADERSRTQVQAAEDRGAAERARAEISAARSEMSAARAEAAQARSELASQREQVAGQHTLVAQARAEAADAAATAAQYQSQVAGALAERDAALAQVQALQADQQRMVDQFKVTAAEQLQAQAKLAEAEAARRQAAADEAAARRQKDADALIEPLTKRLTELQQQMVQLEKERAQSATELREQVRQVTATGLQVSRETAALTTALRKPQVRGQWGELQLKRAAELSGMLEHVDFEQQQTTSTSSEQVIRPDMTVLLSEDRFIYVDSKVPLSAFLDAQEAEQDAERQRLLDVFGKNVRTHVDQLSGKQYYKAASNTPEFVVMFIPSEALAAEALQRMPDLMEYSSRKNVIIATPLTLIGMLKSMSYSWRQAALADNARQVFELGRELYDRLATMGEHVNKLGRALGTALNAYNQTVGSLETRVLPAARKFQNLDVVDKQLADLSPADAAPRPLTAPELMTGPQELLPADEAEISGRRDPSAAELAAQDRPARSSSVRKLG